MNPSMFFLCLAAVIMLQQSGIAACDHNHGPDMDTFIKVNSTVLDKFIQKKINEAFNGDHPFQSTSGADFVKSIIKQMFADQPIIKMFNMVVGDKRDVILYRKTLRKTLWSSTMIANLSLANPSVSVTSSNNLLAYRPKFKDFHKSNLAGIFLNAKELTCGSRMCKILPDEEDGFNKGRAIIEAGDGGNHFRVFNSKKYIPTYGFAIAGCPEMNEDCLPRWYSFNIVCYVSHGCVYPRHV